MLFRSLLRNELFFPDDCNNQALDDLTVQIGLLVCKTWLHKFTRTDKVTYKYLSEFNGPNSWGSLRKHRKELFGVHLDNNPSESAFGFASYELDGNTNITYGSASSVAHAQYNHDLDRVEFNKISNGSFLTLDYELQVTFIYLGMRMAPAACKFERMSVDAQNEYKLEKRRLENKMKLAAIANDYKNHLLYLEKYHSRKRWQKEWHGVHDFEKLTQAQKQLRCIEQIKMRVIGCRWHHLKHLYTIKGKDVPAVDLMEHLVNVIFLFEANPNNVAPTLP